MAAARSSVCVLVSGGLDSAVLLAKTVSRASRVLPIYVRCGLRWEEAELHWLKRFMRAQRGSELEPLKVVELPARSLYGEHWSLSGMNVPSAKSRDAAVYLPGRNVLLTSLAAIVCVPRGYSQIAIGVLAHNPFGDATPEFFRSMGGSLSAALGKKVRIAAPLAGMTKDALIRAAARIRLELTFSCLAPVGVRHCGRCNKCAERRRAFKRCGRPDPTRYVRSQQI